MKIVVGYFSGSGYTIANDLRVYLPELREVFARLSVLEDEFGDSRKLFKLVLGDHCLHVNHRLLPMANAAILRLRRASTNTDSAAQEIQS